MKAKTRKGGVRTIGGKKYMRVRIGKSRRETIPLPACRTDEEALARCEIVADVAQQLLAGGRADKVKDIGVQLGAATSDKQIAVIRKAVTVLLDRGPRLAGDNITFGKFAELWTTGELHRRYPDHVKKKKRVRDDVGRLNRHILPHVGDVPLKAFRLEDAEHVMARLSDHDRAAATRRHVAQIMKTLLRYAVYPARIISHSPLPDGFLPKVGATKALEHLYADEDARLLACPKVPLFYRLLYGIYIREGFRKEELLSLERADVDLVHGVVRLDENKTNEPRAWALSEGVAEALTIWIKTLPKTQRRLFDGEWTTVHLAERMRDHLALAGITRPELFERSAARQPLRIHDLRATFVTLRLAEGKTEAWVQDRTGHKSTLMIAKYRRAARKVEQLGHAPLRPLIDAIPELRELAAEQARAEADGAKVGQEDGVVCGKNEAASAEETVMNSDICGLRGTRTHTSFRTTDFKESADEAPERRHRSNKDKRRVRAASAEALPHPLPQLAKGLAVQRVTWDLFDLFEADAEEVAS